MNLPKEIKIKTTEPNGCTITVDIAKTFNLINISDEWDTIQIAEDQVPSLVDALSKLSKSLRS